MQVVQMSLFLTFFQKRRFHRRHIFAIMICVVPYMCVFYDYFQHQLNSIFYKRIPFTKGYQCNLLTLLQGCPYSLFKDAQDLLIFFNRVLEKRLHRMDGQGGFSLLRQDQLIYSIAKLGKVDRQLLGQALRQLINYLLNFSIIASFSQALMLSYSI